MTPRLTRKQNQIIIFIFTFLFEQGLKSTLSNHGLATLSQDMTPLLSVKFAQLQKLSLYEGTIINLIKSVRFVVRGDTQLLTVGIEVKMLIQALNLCYIFLSIMHFNNHNSWFAAPSYSSPALYANKGRPSNVFSSIQGNRLLPFVCALTSQSPHDFSWM